MPRPYVAFFADLNTYLTNNGIQVDAFQSYNEMLRNGCALPSERFQIADTYFSPVLNAIIYWFLQKSINMFGEAMVKALAAHSGVGITTSNGIEIIRNYWASKGIVPSSIQITDGSGLSPSNKITTQSLAHILQFARSQPWFGQFYNNLPVMNGIKMKSGYIGGVRSYAGYIKSFSGKEYTFAFIVNNFYGDAGSIREKMWKLLDLLK
jgi:D-alanyl-D-alanine carboxypeptidase/D-alanyl-D-alanine-endopeptidase (penicillin-binding protein 4)